MALHVGRAAGGVRTAQTPAGSVNGCRSSFRRHRVHRERVAREARQKTLPPAICPYAALVVSSRCPEPGYLCSGLGYPHLWLRQEAPRPRRPRCAWAARDREPVLGSPQRHRSKVGLTAACSPCAPTPPCLWAMRTLPAGWRVSRPVARACCYFRARSPRCEQNRRARLLERFRSTFLGEDK